MRATKGIVVSEDDSPSETPINPKSKVLFKLLVSGDRTPSEGLTMGIGEIPAGASILLHHHEPEEVYYVLEGEGTVEIENSSTHIGPGSAIFIPRNAQHQTINTGEVPLRLVFVFPTDTFHEIEYHYAD